LEGEQIQDVVDNLHREYILESKIHKFMFGVRVLRSRNKIGGTIGDSASA
jgi:hypothetical protein